MMIRLIIIAINRIGVFLQEVFSQMFSSIRKMFGGQEKQMMNELVIIRNNSEGKQIVLNQQTDTTFAEAVITTALGKIVQIKEINELINGGIHYFKRLTLDTSMRKNIQKYTRMERKERLHKMCELIIYEGLMTAEITINKNALKMMANFCVNIYEEILDGVPPIFAITNAKENLENKLEGCQVIDCNNKMGCNDLHFVLKTSKKNRVNIIRFGQATSIDLATYASNKNFSKIAVISQLEFSMMFAIKSITTLNIDSTR